MTALAIAVFLGLLTVGYEIGKGLVAIATAINPDYDDVE